MNTAPRWVFGYGSIIWHADFPYLDAKQAYITGWERRFWQGSHDHRGTVQSPGRVVTLIAIPGAKCAGCAYLVKTDVFEHLDFREKNGYERYSTEIIFTEGNKAEGVVYIAPKENPAFLGPASVEHIAQQICVSHGPSGSNLEYFQELAHSLRGLGHIDDHVLKIETAVCKIVSNKSQKINSNSV